MKNSLLIFEKKKVLVLFQRNPADPVKKKKKKFFFDSAFAVFGLGFLLIPFSALVWDQ